MSGVLYGVGAIAFVLGVVTIGFGVPSSDFSFGNTLIVAGTTAAVGGLIIVALGVAVSRLEQLAEALVPRVPGRPVRPAEAFEAPTSSRAAPGPGRTNPPKIMPDPGIREPYPPQPRMDAAAPADDMAEQEYPPQEFPPQRYPAQASPVPSFAPTLRNPDEPPVTVEEEVSLSPPLGSNGSGMADKRQENREGAKQFDTMWPDQPKPSRGEPKAEESRRNLAAPAKRPPAEPPAAGILKSGVVDGMGYTLYVDGSIEAKLPQGTLRFASINELRSHLEKNA